MPGIWIFLSTMVLFAASASTVLCENIDAWICEAWDEFVYQVKCKPIKYGAAAWAQYVKGEPNEGNRLK